MHLIYSGINLFNSTNSQSSYDCTTTVSGIGVCVCTRHVHSHQSRTLISMDMSRSFGTRRGIA